MIDRRAFLVTAGAAIAASRVRAQQSPVATAPDPLRAPDQIVAFAEGESTAIALTRSGERWQARDIEVSREQRADGAAVFITAPKTRLTRIRLRWRGAFPVAARFLGDHWERSYGDLEWRGLVGDRLMPWYFLVSAGGAVHGHGVKTGASAICSWQADAGGVTLWLDVSNGGSGVELGERHLEAATLVTRRGRPGESALAAAHAFCVAMCPRPRLSP